MECFAENKIVSGIKFVFQKLFLFRWKNILFCLYLVNATPLPLVLFPSHECQEVVLLLSQADISQGGGEALLWAGKERLDKISPNFVVHSELFYCVFVTMANVVQSG